MTDPLSASLKIAGSGMEAQATRLRIVSENIANSRSTATRLARKPYRRKTITFGTTLDKVSGAQVGQCQETWRGRVGLQAGI